jgi:hypothetical protein
VPSITTDLSAELQAALGLRRAVETGTYVGDGARRLAARFPEVVTIELSEELHEVAAGNLADLPQVRPLLGSSVDHLPALAAEGVPTLYFLDGHYSGPATAGSGQECPVLDELDAIGAGHPGDAIVIDDARLFAAPPPPPHDPAQWPTLIEVFDRLRALRPDSHVTMLDDQVIAVPPSARAVVDAYGQRLAAESASNGAGPRPAGAADKLRDLRRSIGARVRRPRA